MFKKITSIIAAGLISTTLCMAAAPANWEAHKTIPTVWRLDLAGVTPTSTQCSNNFFRIGDIIVDTSSSYMYIVSDSTPSAPQFVKTIASGLSSPMVNGSSVSATGTELDRVADVSALSTNGYSATLVATSVETLNPIQKTVITLAATNMVFTTGSDEGESFKIWTFPKGGVTILSALMDFTYITSLGATGDYYYAMGSAAAGDDADLTSTEANIIPKSTISTDGSVVNTNAADSVLLAPITIDGTTTAVPLYFNAAMANADMGGVNQTSTISGTLTLFWINNGSNK